MPDRKPLSAALAGALWSIAGLLGIACVLIWMTNSAARSSTNALIELSQRLIAYGQANTGSSSDIDHNAHTRGYQGLPTNSLQTASGRPIVLRKGKELCVYLDGQHVVLSDPWRDRVLVSDGYCPFATPPPPIVGR